MREYQDRNQDDRDDHLEENQRIGKRIAQDSRYQNWNQEYRSGRDYHNNPEPNKEGRQHYGADPNSAYRNSNLNYGDGRDQREGYGMGRNDQQPYQNNRTRDWNQENRYQENRFNQGNRNQNNYQPDNRYNQENRYDKNRFNRSDNQFYQGEEPRFMDDRKHFKADDYRYGSGNRQWESPGYDRRRDQDNDDDRNYSRGREQRDERGFFGRIADEIRDDWRTFTHPHDEHNQDRRHESRNFNRGYEPGPRWADEDDSWDGDRRRGRNQDENYNRW